MKSFPFKLAAALATVAILVAPMSVAAKTVTKHKTLSRLASVQYLDNGFCFRDNISAVVSKIEEKNSDQPTSVTHKLEVSVFRFDTCTQQSVINETLVISDPSKFKIKDTKSASADYKGTFPSGTPVEVHLKWTANGSPQTEEFYNKEQENGCQVVFTGSHTTSSPYTVTGSVVVSGEDYIDGLTPVNAVVARDISRTSTACR